MKVKKKKRRGVGRNTIERFKHIAINHFVNVHQRDHLKLLTSAGTDARLDSEFIGGLAGASQRRWFSVVLVTPQVPWHWQEEETTVIPKVCLGTPGTQTTLRTTRCLSSSLSGLALITQHGKCYPVLDPCHVFQTCPGINDRWQNCILSS